MDLEEFDRNRETFRLDDPDLLDDETFKVVYTGSIRLVNNLGKIVEMAEYMKEHGEDKIKFLLYGDGTEREELIKLCQEKGLDNIKFPGKVEKNIFRLFCLVLTSTSTMLNRPVLCGLDAV